MTCYEIQAQIDAKAAELIPLQAALTVAQAAKIVSQAALIAAMMEDSDAASDVADAESAYTAKLAEKQAWEAIFITSGC